MVGVACAKDADLSDSESMRYKVLDEKIRLSEKTAATKLKHSVEMLLNEFNVPNVIGSGNCPFSSYREFINEQQRFNHYIRERVHENQAITQQNRNLLTENQLTMKLNLSLFWENKKETDEKFKSMREEILEKSFLEVNSME